MASRPFSPQPKPLTEPKFPDSKLALLKEKLSAATFPDELDSADWDYGSPLADIKKLTAYWKDEFDWRKQEELLNRLPQFTTSIPVTGFETLEIHFVYQRSKAKRAIPLLFVHGWLGSFIEAAKVLPLLTAGGADQPAFHVVAPSLPNFGFSEGTKKKGFAMPQYAEACHKLMLTLGFPQYVTQGGDWGSWITRSISLLYPHACLSSHINYVAPLPPTWSTHPLTTLLDRLTPATDRSRADAERRTWFEKEGRGYGRIQSTKPQTLGYALADSPVGLLAWIYEKLHDWTDAYPWTPDEILTWVSIYWFSRAGPAASLRIYYEMNHSILDGEEPRIRLRKWISKVPLGVSYFPRELGPVPKRWGRLLGPVCFEGWHGRGGHFAAWEVPEVLVGDVKRMFGRKGGAFGVVKGFEGFDIVERSKL